MAIHYELVKHIKEICQDYLGCVFNETKEYDNREPILCNDDNTQFVSCSRTSKVENRNWIYFNVGHVKKIKDRHPNSSITFVCLLNEYVLFLISDKIQTELFNEGYIRQHSKYNNHIEIHNEGGKYKIRSKTTHDEEYLNIESKNYNNIIAHIVKRKASFYGDIADDICILPIEYEVCVNELDQKREFDYVNSDTSLLSKEQIIVRLKKLNDLNTKTVTVIRGENKAIVYRDAYQVELIKKLRNYKCQFCGTSIIKKCGGLYVEACHIKPKAQGGNESLNNILILCPNCHKTFDLGDRKEIEHNTMHYIVEVNGHTHNIAFENNP